MATPRSTSDFYRSQQRLTVLTIAAARRVWARMGTDFDRSWVDVGPRLAVLASAAQIQAARTARDYLPRVLAETDQPDQPDGTVNPRAFVGTAPDGRSLDGLLFGSVTESKTAVGYGLTPGAALAQGARWLDMAIHGVVTDTGRSATGVGVFSRPRMGWVRMVNPPCCSRCAILAGKWFRSNQGFDRHPRCDCTHIPSIEDRADDFTTDPQLLVERGQITDLSKADRYALDNGADLNQVVNSRRGRSGLTTTEGTTRRGIAGARLITGDPTALIAPRGGDTIQREAFQRTQRLRDGRVVTQNVRISQARQARLTPEGIYRTANSRDEALALLRQHGYLI